MFITNFGHFYVCFYLVGDVRADGSKKEQIEGKIVNFEIYVVLSLEIDWKYWSYRSR